MKIKSLSLLVLVSVASSLFAGNETLLKIGDNAYGVEEFNYIYEKNNELSQKPLSREEYLDLFVNYKLKVVEAQAQGLDTLPSFVKELKYYRDELAKPYLTDKKAEEEVIQEAYNHLVNEISASHILIKVGKMALPPDTLEAYNKILDIRKQLMNGADFGELAVKYSEDPSAVQNKGYLGYFSGFMMVYPFEKAAYETPIDSVSDVVKTSFGYHLIKVHGTRKNRGEVQVAHIMKMVPRGSAESFFDVKKVEIDSLYQLLKDGQDFAEVAKKFSDDKQTGVNGGELPFFGSGRMVPEFENAAFALQDSGDISVPVKTAFGWHILKKLDARPIPPLEDQRENIKKRISKDGRGLVGQKATVARLRKEYNIQQDSAKLKKLADLAYEAKSNSSEPKDLFAALANYNEEIVNLADLKIKNSDCMTDLMKGGYSSSFSKREDFFPLWDNFINDQLINLEKSKLEEKYPDFRFLMNEYHDGLLIFEISQNEVWNKASSDTTGLEAFFTKNIKDYYLPERFEGTVYKCSAKKDVKTLKAFFAANDSLPSDSLPTGLAGEVVIEKGSFNKGTDAAIDLAVWGVKSKTKSKVYLVTKGEVKQPEAPALSAVRGQVVSDYQTLLEKQWITGLREKYKPVVDKALIKK